MNRRDTLRIELPIPLTVLAPLMEVIGRMWPDATVSQEGSHMVAHLPDVPARKVTKKTLTDILNERAAHDDDPAPDVELIGWSHGGPTLGLDAADEAWQGLASWAYTILSALDAPNFVTQTISCDLPDGTPARLALAVAWSKAQLPDVKTAASTGETARLSPDLTRVREWAVGGGAASDEVRADVAALVTEVERNRRGPA